MVIPLVAILRLGDPTAFRDEENISPGMMWAKAISAAIEVADKILVMWTAAAAKSSHVEMEYLSAIRLNKAIIPVLLDDTDLPEPLKQYQWIDFRPFVKTASQRLIEDSDLPAEGMPNPSIIGGLIGALAGYSIFRKKKRREITVFSDEAASQMRAILAQRLAVDRTGEA